MVMEVKTRRIVTCPNKDLCHNPDCMHYREHEPIRHGEGRYENCHDELTICPLCGGLVQCQSERS